MKNSELMNKVISFIYDEYQKDDSFKSDGESAGQIMMRYYFNGNNDFFDVGAQVGFLNLLIDKGWIKVIKPSKLKKPNNGLSRSDYITLTPDGIEYVENIRNPNRKIMGIIANTAELIGRFVKGRLGE